jgi:hypothetical protein
VYWDSLEASVYLSRKRYLMTLDPAKEIDPSIRLLHRLTIGFQILMLTITFHKQRFASMVIKLEVFLGFCVFFVVCLKRVIATANVKIVVTHQILSWFA